jgi:hypothetical protein
MKRPLVLTAFALSMLASAPLAFAQTPAPATPAAAPAAATPAQKLEKVEDRIKQLHAKLGITADQQPKFDAFAQVMRDQAEASYESRENKVDASLSAPDEMQRYADMAQTHADAMKALVPSFKSLYDSLSDAQKKKADALFAHPRDNKKH